MTDYHSAIRDAGETAIKAACDALATALGVDPLPWHVVDDLADATRKELPCGVVCAVGPEQDRPALNTNARDGIGYAFAVMLLAAGTTRGEKTLGPTDLTTFRRLVRETFHMKRLSGVTEVCWCEVGDAGPLVDEKQPLFQRLATALVVTAVGRFPRTT